MYGEEGADTLDGGDGNDYVNGGDGNDKILQKGADTIQAGTGDDTISISDTDFRLVDGGSGDDTINLDGYTIDDATIDLSNLDQTHSIKDIETIDLSGKGANTLKLDIDDILDMTDEDNELFIKGDSEDKVEKDDNLTRDESKDITKDDISYHAYYNQDSQVTLYVEEDVGVVWLSPVFFLFPYPFYLLDI